MRRHQSPELPSVKPRLFLQAAPILRLEYFMRPTFLAILLGSISLAAAEPAPAALDLTLPERGVALDFRRSVQIEDGRPMAIELHLRRAGTGLPWIAMPLCLLIAAAAIGNGRRRA